VTKVLCKGGPYYWIKEPLTELERRVRAHHRAEDVRDWQKRGVKIEGLEELHAQWLSEAPQPPVTKAELKQYKKEYPDRYYLAQGEIWPLSPAEERKIWADHAKAWKGPVTMVRG
jgi:hypothetical protein